MPQRMEKKNSPSPNVSSLSQKRLRLHVSLSLGRLTAGANAKGNPNLSNVAVGVEPTAKLVVQHRAALCLLSRLCVTI